MTKPDEITCEFISFCKNRCDAGWPKLYDEMCWVAGHRLFRGMGYAELKEIGLSFGISDIDNIYNLIEAVDLGLRESSPLVREAG